MLEALSSKVRFSKPRKFDNKENATWTEIMKIQRPRRGKQLHPMFEEGLKLLDMDKDSIPDLSTVNRKLKSLTGWQGVFVEGLEGGETFYDLLKNKVFPIGNFIRDKRDLNYTPEPDIVHDFYGHIPFYANRGYADFNQSFGELAMKYVDDPKKFRQFERVFWFTCEFGLIKSEQGLRIFGAGIASSVGECEYALSQQPEIIEFDLNKVRLQEFRIDEMQKKLFLLESTQQLYTCLEELENYVRKS